MPEVTTDYTLSRLGAEAKDASTVAKSIALFRDQLQEEVLTIFETKSVMLPLHEVKTIESGYAAMFDTLGDAAATYQDDPANDDSTGQQLSHGKKLINIDEKMLSASTKLGKLDMAMAHRDWTSPYAAKLAQAMAKRFDQHCLNVLALAAGKASIFGTEGYGGTTLYNSEYLTDTTMTKLAVDLFQAAEILDSKDVPEEDRYFITTPQVYRMLAQNTVAINSLYGGSGAYKDGTIFKIAGFDIIKTNNLATSSIASDAAGYDVTQNTYYGDFTDNVGICFHRGAIGTVKLLEIDSFIDDRRRKKEKHVYIGTDMAKGTDFLRPECVVLLNKSASATTTKAEGTA